MNKKNINKAPKKAHKIIKQYRNGKKAVFLFDYTGIMALPWADAGYICYCFDDQHPVGATPSDHPNIINVGLWFIDKFAFPYGERKNIERVKRFTGNDVSFVFGFPECTDLTVAGARHFESKRKKNPRFQLEAMQLVKLVMLVGEEYKCPYGLENPVGVISTMWRKPDFRFHPCDYAGYLPEDDIHPFYPEIYPTRDRYNKNTCIWHDNGFIEPDKKRLEPLSKHNPGWKKCGGKSTKTKNIRSATPRGFAQAVFEANNHDRNVNFSLSLLTKRGFDEPG